MAPGAVLGMASPAMASVSTPPFGPPYTALDACPLDSPLLNDTFGAYDFFACYGSTSGGESFIIGATTVTLTHLRTVQGGLRTNPNAPDFNSSFVPAPADNGQTLVAQPEQVPRGLTSVTLPNTLPGGLGKLVNNPPTGLTAQVQLRAPTSRSSTRSAFWPRTRGYLSFEFP